jgi:hypothetical protein
VGVGVGAAPPLPPHASLGIWRAPAKKWWKLLSLPPPPTPVSVCEPPCTSPSLNSLPSIVMPVAELTELCKASGVLVLIDGAHALGQIPVNVTAIGADFWLGNGVWAATGVLNGLGPLWGMA